MALKTRRPTGRPAWPLVLVEGGEKAGKSWLAAELAHSPKIGRTVWFDLGEGSADEYLDPNDPRHEVVEHDGTFAALLNTVADAKDEAAKALANGERPMLFVLDTGTAEWEMLSAIADQRARARLAKKLKRDIDADETVTIGVDLWNEANAKHRKLMTMLMTFPGIVVITARGKEVAQMGADGRPVEGRRDYKVEGHKNLAFDASVWIRLSRDEPPKVVGARSKRAGIRPGVDKPRVVPDLTLENLLFGVLGLDSSTAQARDLVNPTVTEADLAEPASEYTAALEVAIDSASTEDELRAAHGQIKPALDAGRITKPDADRLYARVQERKPEVTSAPRRPDPPAHASNEPPSTSTPHPVYATPEMVSDRQLRHMHALFGELGLSDRDARLSRASEVLGTPVGSTRDLTAEMAGRLISWLEAERESQRVARAWARSEAAAKGEPTPAPDAPPAADSEPEPGLQTRRTRSTTTRADATEQRNAVLAALAAAGYTRPTQQREYVNSVLAPRQIRSWRDLTADMCEAVLAALSDRAGASA